ncbi:hypothetical protein E2986_10879, partial [Frieseomelitta varia]
SVANSAGKVEGPETQEAKESVNGSRAEVGPDVASKLSSLFAGLPSLAGPQRLATTLRQRFANNSETKREKKENFSIGPRGAKSMYYYTSADEENCEIKS